MYLTVFTSIPVTWFTLLINSIYPFQSQNQIQTIKDKQFIKICLDSVCYCLVQANCLLFAWWWTLWPFWWIEKSENWWDGTNNLNFIHSYVFFSLRFHQLWWFTNQIYPYNMVKPWNTQKIVELHLGNKFTYIYIHYIQFWTVAIFGTCWLITCSIIIQTVPICIVLYVMNHLEWFK